MTSKGLNHRAQAPAAAQNVKQRHAGKGKLPAATAKEGSASDANCQGGQPVMVTHYPPRNSGNPGQN